MENVLALLAILFLSVIGVGKVAALTFSVGQRFVQHASRGTVRTVSSGTLALAVAVLVLAGTGISYAQTPAPLSFDIDVQPLFDAIQLYLPPLLAILAIGGGIKIAIKLASFLINSISGAFGGA